MLEVARNKAKDQDINVGFFEGDMRVTKVGKFDAAITIFNAVGHLTRSDFKKAMTNIYDNLKPKGIYIFDIFNLSYLLEKDNISKLTIDWITKKDSITFREIQYSTIDDNGILTSYDIYYKKEVQQKPEISTAHQTSQIYRANELKDMLEESGFKTIEQFDIDGNNEFKEKESERILTIAYKD